MFDFRMTLNDRSSYFFSVLGVKTDFFQHRHFCWSGRWFRLRLKCEYIQYRKHGLAQLQALDGCWYVPSLRGRIFSNISIYE